MSDFISFYKEEIYYYAHNKRMLMRVAEYTQTH